MNKLIFLLLLFFTIHSSLFAADESVVVIYKFDKKGELIEKSQHYIIKGQQIKIWTTNHESISGTLTQINDSSFQIENHYILFKDIAAMRFKPSLKRDRNLGNIVGNAILINSAIPFMFEPWFLHKAITDNHPEGWHYAIYFCGLFSIANALVSIPTGLIIQASATKFKMNQTPTVNNKYNFQLIKIEIKEKDKRIRAREEF